MLTTRHKNSSSITKNPTDVCITTSFFPEPLPPSPRSTTVTTSPRSTVAISQTCRWNSRFSGRDTELNVNVQEPVLTRKTKAGAQLATFEEEDFEKGEKALSKPISPPKRKTDWYGVDKYENHVVDPTTAVMLRCYNCGRANLKASAAASSEVGEGAKQQCCSCARWFVVAKAKIL